MSKGGRMVFRVGSNGMGDILSLLFLRFVLEKYASRMFIANKFYHTMTTNRRIFGVVKQYCRIFRAKNVLRI